MTISLDNDLLEQLDNFADDNGMTRSGLIGVACRQYLTSIQAMPSMLAIVQKLGDLAAKGAGMSDQDRASLISELDQDQVQLLGMLNR